MEIKVQPEQVREILKTYLRANISKDELQKLSNEFAGLLSTTSHALAQVIVKEELRKEIAKEYAQMFKTDLETAIYTLNEVKKML